MGEKRWWVGCVGCETFGNARSTNSVGGNSNVGKKERKNEKKEEDMVAWHNNQPQKRPVGRDRDRMT